MSEGKSLVPEGSPFELWDVRLISGDFKLTIDELDAAFEAGQIDANTLVRRRGTVRWQTLGQAANLEATVAAPPAPVAAPVAELIAEAPRPAVPRPTPRGTVRPPPLPASELAKRISVAPIVIDARVVEAMRDASPPPAPLPPLPAIDAHVSSLPPPVTVSTAPEPFEPPRPAIPSTFDDTNAALASLRPRPRRGRLFAATFVLALVGGGAVAAWKVPSLPARVTAVLHLPNPAPVALATPAPPAAAEPLPSASVAPPPTASASASASASTSAPAPAVSHAPPVHSAVKAPAKAPALPAKPKAAAPRTRR